MEPYNGRKAADSAESDFVNTKASQPSKRTIWSYFREYCENSSVHGVRYLGEPKRPILERIWWIIIFVISITCCGALILSIWQKWESSPVMVTFNDKSMPVWKIPFPAITICPDSKFHKHKIDILEFINDDLNFTNNIVRMENKVFSLVCDRILHHTKGDKFVNASIISKLEEMTTPLEDVLELCEKEKHRGDCDFFSKIITEDGICFTYNILSQSEMFHNESIQNEYPYVYETKLSNGWTLEKGYPEYNNASTYPNRALGAGSAFQLQVILKVKRNTVDSTCKLGNLGYKVLLHHPADFPRIGQQYFRLPLDQEVVVSIKPNVMTTSERLRGYDPHRRQCFFPSERHLQFYKTYTQANCELECVANYTLKKCGCVMISMPRNNTTPICGPGSIACKDKAQGELLVRDISLDGQQGAVVDGDANCDCLPSCASIQYDAELSQSSFHLDPLAPLIEKFNSTVYALSRLSIYFREPQIITSHRSELYGQTDFIANCGGLLGLFMGVSILSVVEVIYFVTLRIFYTIKMQRKENVEK